MSRRVGLRANTLLHGCTSLAHLKAHAGEQKVANVLLHAITEIA